MADGSLIFDTGLDNSGFKKGVSMLTTAAVAAAATVTTAFSAAAISAAKVGTAYTSSMSQVAATMGIDRTSEEYDTLARAAKDMGASTKYSASQAADALNYLALAGYDAQKSVEALPTVLNVAAAGGIDLASASDMITDSMSALGLGMDELESFSDKLAKTSQKSNTSVAQLGEAILTVGGTAKMLSGGVTELNTMLGLIADNGIKGAEGGTALRNIILSLSAPTDKAAAALKDLNVNAFDSSGNMRDLSSVFGELNEALAPLTEQEKTEVLNSIFNKVDLKAVNALLGTSAERFGQLKGEIENCDGAASQMAKTMSDNLQGDIDSFKSALEGVGISAFERFETPLRTAVGKVTDILKKLNKALEGELGDKLETLAEKLGDMAVSAAEFAADEGLPKLIDALEWICDNKDELIIAAESIGAMVITLNALSAVGSVVNTVSSISALTSAATGAAGAAGALGSAMTAIPWVAVATLAIGAGVALRGEIERERELIGYEGDIKEAYNEANREIAIQNNLLMEKAESSSAADRQEAYRTAKADMESFTDDLENNNARLAELYEKRKSISIQRDNIHDTLSNADSWNRMTTLNAELDAVEQEINGIEEQNTHLQTALIERKHIVKELGKVFETALPSNMGADAAKRAEEYAKSHFDSANRYAADTAAAQEDMTEKLAAGFKELDHLYATGAITDERVLYERKKALVQQYGNAQLEGHWKYYEELYSYEKQFAKESEEAEEERLDKIKKLQETAAEKALEAERKSYRDRLSVTTTAINSLVSEYKRSMSELESNISSYKARLLSVGDIFSMTESTDENGKKTRTYTVENLKEQMAQMTQYAEYVKKLKASGASQGLLEELTSMDFEDGLQFGKYLSGMSDSEFGEINDYYKQRDALADELSKDLYAGEAEKINNALLSSVDTALEQLPEQAQAAGRQFLADFISGLDLTSDDISDDISAFVSGFSEIYNSALSDMDLEHPFAVALGGMDSYAMGQSLARELAAGFNDEIDKSISEIRIKQTAYGASLSGGTAGSTATTGSGTNETVVFENTNHITVEMDGEVMSEKLEKKTEERNRRRGK